MMAAAPLLALGLPQEAVDRLSALPGRWGDVVQTLWSPVVGTLAFNVTVVTWHVPFLYELTLHSDAIHDQEHLTMLVGSVLFWGTILRPAPCSLGELGPRTVALIATVVVNSLLGSFLFFAPRPLYATYAAAPRLWQEIDPGTDQALGGGLMWAWGDMMYLGLLLWLIGTLLAQEEHPSAHARGEEGVVASDLLLVNGNIRR